MTEGSWKEAEKRASEGRSLQIWEQCQHHLRPQCYTTGSAEFPQEPWTWVFCRNPYNPSTLSKSMLNVMLSFEDVKHRSMHQLHTFLDLIDHILELQLRTWSLHFKIRLISSQKSKS